MVLTCLVEPLALAGYFHINTVMMSLLMKQGLGNIHSSLFISQMKNVRTREIILQTNHLLLSEWFRE